MWRYRLSRVVKDWGLEVDESLYGEGSRAGCEERSWARLARRYHDPPSSWSHDGNDGLLPGCSVLAALCKVSQAWTGEHCPPLPPSSPTLHTVHLWRAGMVVSDAFLIIICEFVSLQERERERETPSGVQSVCCSLLEGESLCVGGFHLHRKHGLSGTTGMLGSFICLPAGQSFIKVAPLWRVKPPMEACQQPTTSLDFHFLLIMYSCQLMSAPISNYCMIVSSLWHHFCLTRPQKSSALLKQLKDVEKYGRFFCFVLGFFPSWN